MIKRRSANHSWCPSLKAARKKEPVKKELFLLWEKWLNAICSWELRKIYVTAYDARNMMNLSRPLPYGRAIWRSRAQCRNETLHGDRETFI